MSKLSRYFIIGLFVIMIPTIFIVNLANAEEKQYYVGVGGSYIFTNFSYGDVVDWDSYTWGGNAKLGYRLARTLYLQLDADYVSKVDGVLKSDPSVGGDVEVFTGILSLKGYFPNFTIIRPFVIAGAGIMHYNVDYNDTAQSAGFPLPDDKETDLCFKVGGGVDFFINDIVSLGIEGNYTGGLEEVKDVKYINVSAGINFYF
ncbi:MAG: outer membrane beta-barrel protein [Desulfosarcina sp.]|jgi:opacity protein-like surface antigen